MEIMLSISIICYGNNAINFQNFYAINFHNLSGHTGKIHIGCPRLNPSEQYCYDGGGAIGRGAKIRLRPHDVDVSFFSQDTEAPNITSWKLFSKLIKVFIMLVT